MLRIFLVKLIFFYLDKTAFKLTPISLLLSGERSICEEGFPPTIWINAVQKLRSV